MLKLDDSIESKLIRKKLIEDYPFLLPRNRFTDEVATDYKYEYIEGEFDLPVGWFELFLQMCEDIKEPLEKADCLEKFRFSQIKEKYGSMRAYVFGAPQEVYDIISKYEFLSQQVCCMCGKPAEYMTSGWISPFCKEHVYELVKDTSSCDDIEIDTCFYVTCYYIDGHSTETKIDCSSEWQRYLERIGESL